MGNKFKGPRSSIFFGAILARAGSWLPLRGCAGCGYTAGSVLL